MTMHAGIRPGSAAVAFAVALALACGLGVALSSGDPLPNGPPRCPHGAATAALARTELFFGLSRPGGTVSDAEFSAFVDSQIAPRFPDGMTLLSGSGRFRDPRGASIVEGSKLLVLLYPPQDADASRRVEQIRSAYKQRFEQQSVLRVDAAACVSF